MKKYLFNMLLIAIMMGCSKDDTIKKYFSLDFGRTVQIENGKLPVSFDVGDGPGLKAGVYDPENVNIVNGSREVTINGVDGRTIVKLNGLLAITYDIGTDGYGMSTVEVTNGISNKYINVQTYVREGVLQFVSVARTINGSERDPVISFDDSIFGYDLFSDREMGVYIDNETEQGREFATLAGTGSNLGFVTAKGGTDIFPLIVRQL